MKKLMLIVILSLFGGSAFALSFSFNKKIKRFRPAKLLTSSVIKGIKASAIPKSCRSKFKKERSSYLNTINV